MRQQSESKKKAGTPAAGAGLNKHPWSVPERDHPHGCLSTQQSQESSLKHFDAIEVIVNASHSYKSFRATATTMATTFHAQAPPTLKPPAHQGVFDMMPGANHMQQLRIVQRAPVYDLPAALVAASSAHWRVVVTHVETSSA